jgi:two-component system CheB/CheR fusion protein
VRRRDEFLAMLSHELRNPLGAIVSAIAVLKVADVSKAQQHDRLLKIMERQTAQMARLLDDLLDASRVTQDKIELRRSVLDLRRVLKDAEDAMRPVMESRGLGFSVEIDAEPIYVDGDPARLQQIHINLLSNAAKYTPRGGHVRLEAKRQDGMAHIRVTDDGVGLSKDVLDSAFELFVQSHRTLDRSDGGLGVGLTLVRGLVAKHGGEVTAHSDGEGKGSEFVVTLPLSAAPDGYLSNDPSQENRVKLPKGSRIVVIEDNADSREMLCDLLTHVGLDCRSCDSGTTALALIDDFRPRAAIIDIGLPGIDGLELARRLRSNPQHKGLFLIALTGYGQRADRDRALAAGFDEHLVKPTSFEVLKRMIGDGPTDGARIEPAASN